MEQFIQNTCWILEEGTWIFRKETKTRNNLHITEEDEGGNGRQKKLRNGMGPTSLGGNWKEKIYHLSTSGEIPWNKIGAIEESLMAILGHPGQSETWTDCVCHSPAHPRLSENDIAGWVRKHGIGRGTQRKDSCWLPGDSLKEWVWGVPRQEMLIVEVKTALELRCHCWVACKGQRGHNSFLSPHTSLYLYEHSEGLPK